MQNQTQKPRKIAGALDIVAQQRKIEIEIGGRILTRGIFDQLFQDENALIFLNEAFKHIANEALEHSNKVDEKKGRFEIDCGILENFADNIVSFTHLNRLLIELKSYERLDEKSFEDANDFLQLIGKSLCDFIETCNTEEVIMALSYFTGDLIHEKTGHSNKQSAELVSMQSIGNYISTMIMIAINTLNTWNYNKQEIAA